jgi:hypothetical protein
MWWTIALPLALAVRALGAVTCWTFARLIPLVRHVVALARQPLGTAVVALATLSLGESAALLVTGDLESRPWILVRSARSPSGSAAFSPAPSRERVARLLRRLPQASACEPHHHGIGMSRLQLLQRRREFLLRRSAERRGLPFENDRPVGMARRH